MKFKARNLQLLACTLLIALTGLFAACGESADENGNQGGTAEFDVTINQDASTLDVTEGDTVTVEADIENVGSATGTQTIEFSAGSASESQDLQLEAEASETLTFEWETSEGDEGDYTAEVASADNTGSADVTVSAPDVNFSVSINQDQSVLTVDKGTNLEIAMVFENTGSDPGTQTPSFTLDGTPVQMQGEGSSEIQLDAGGTEGLGVQFETGDGEQQVGEGDHTFTVETDDDSATADLTVNAGGE